MLHNNERSFSPPTKIKINPQAELMKRRVPGCMDEMMAWKKEELLRGEKGRRRRIRGGGSLDRTG
jgi:hypothetical protein